MPSGIQKRHDFLETLAALHVSIHDDSRFAPALLLLKILEFPGKFIITFLEYRHASHDLGDLGINCSVNFFLAIVRHLLVHERLVARSLLISSTLLRTLSSSSPKELRMIFWVFVTAWSSLKERPFRRTVSIFSSSWIAAGTVIYFCLVSMAFI